MQNAVCSVLLATLVAARASAQATEYAVIVHPDNSTGAVTQRELNEILKADTQFWKGDGRIELLLPRSKSKAKEFLLAEVYRQSEEDLKRYWVELVFRNKIPDVPRVLSSDVVALAFVQKSHGAMAVVEASSLPKDPALKILAIDGKKPGEPGYCLHDRTDKVAVARDRSALATPASAAWIDDDRRAQADQEQREMLRRIEQLEALVDPSAQLSAGERGLELGPRLQLRGFSDVRYGVKEIDSEAAGADSASDAFVLGQLDLLLTSQLGDRLNFLSEIVFAPKSTGQQAANVERVIIKYEVGSSFNVQAGRFHTTLGYWNEAYHHGEWLQTTVGRPQIVAFGGDGGILPIHLIGLALKSNQDLAGLNLDCSLEMGNGRGATRGSEQLVSDTTDPKAINLSFGLRPHALEGLRVGGGFYLDDIPPNASATAGPLHGQIDETILNAFATYRTHSWEVLAELFDIQHDEAGSDADSAGWYAQVGHRFSDWTPYVRIEAQEVDDASTYFENTEDLQRYAVGVRWDMSTWSAIKLQAAHSVVDAAAAGADRDEDELVAQWAYAF